MMDVRQQEVIEAEALRCQAIADGDMRALAALLSDDYLHVHGDGRIGGKADYIAGVERAPRVPVRSNLVVRLFGDVAVLTGDLLNTIDFPDRDKLVIDTTATFVLRAERGAWTFVSGQLTPKRKII
jgi:ketosteroid isomerase-like protein